MASSSRTWRYDVFPSFSGGDVRKSFLSHLLEKLQRKLVTVFIDHGIERSRSIAPELLSAIRESRISIVVFSKNYASSTWCLNELVEIHKCFTDLDQMVIPIFYDVEPSDVRKQTREFGGRFENTCMDKTDDERQRWKQALTNVANLAGEDSKNWSDEANMIEHIAKDVFNKLMMTSSNDFGDFVGIEAHLKALNPILCLESEEVRMLGIVGPSGIGKSTIGRALFSQLSTRFHHHAFVSYKRTHKDDYGMKLRWEEQLLSEILCQKDVKISHLGSVEQKLKHKKVLIIVDDVDDLELLNTLVGQTREVGSGSRIIVITQDKKLLKSHKIDLIYEVEFPTEDLALQMFCRSAFGKNSPPDGFTELAVEVAGLAGNLPLGLSVLGSSLRGMEKEEWVEMLPRLQNNLDGKIEKILRVSYDGLDGKDQDLFLSIACLFSGHKVNHIENLLGDNDKIGLKILANKSLIHIVQSDKTVQMHSLLQKLGRDIVRAESLNNPGKRRFLMDAEDICDVLTYNTGTENVLGIYFNTSEINEPLFIDKNSFEGMRNLQFLKFYKERSRMISENKLYIPQGLVHFPRKLRLLQWNEYPSKCMPFNFRADYLVKLKMMDSKLEKLWEGAQLLRSLKKMDMRWSADLKEMPDLSKAINLEKLNLRGCTSLVTLPSSIRNLSKLRVLSMKGCSKLKVLPADVSLGCLESLDLRECSELEKFPRISKNISELLINENGIEDEEDCSWIENISHLTKLYWDGVPVRCMPSNFCPEYLTELVMRGGRLEKLWGGVKSLGSLKNLVLSGCESLVEVPDLSTATKLYYLELDFCKSLVMLPSSIRNLKHLNRLSMKGCTMLEVLPTNVNLSHLRYLDLRGCSKLRNFPQISTYIGYLYLDDTAIEEVPSRIEKFSLQKLTMRRCKKLKNVSPNIFKLMHIEADFSDCEGITTMRDQFPGSFSFSVSAPFSPPNLGILPPTSLNFTNCFNIDGDAHELILQSYFFCAVLPGGEVPMYFTHRASGTSLIMKLSESVLSQDILGFKACIVVGPPIHSKDCSADIGVRWCFRGRKGVIPFGNEVASCIKDHLVMLFFVFNEEEVYESPSELNNNFLHLEFYYHSYACSCNNFGSDRNTKTCPLLPQRIKGCGVRVVNTETSYHYNSAGNVCEKSDRIKKRMQITTATFQKPSNSLHVQTAVNSGFMTSLKFNNYFNLDRDAPEVILRSEVYFSIIPGVKMPMSFTYRACGNSLSIPLSGSSFSQENFGIKACIAIGPPTRPNDRSADIGVRWCFRGKKGVIPFCTEAASCNIDILVILFFQFSEKEVQEFSSELNSDVLQLEFYYHSRDCSCNNVGPDRNTQTCPLLSQRIKGCGVRVVNICPYPSYYRLDEILAETVYDQMIGEIDEESDRSKKRMRMTAITSEEPSNSQTAIISELMASNLELSLGAVKASALVSSTSNVPSPSRRVHSDDGPSLSLSLSSFDHFLGGETLYFDPMMIDQQDTRTPNEDPSLSPQLVDYFSHGSSSGQT